MSFYDLAKPEREKLTRRIEQDILLGISSGRYNKTGKYFSDNDTYIRKAAYQSVGRIYKNNPALHEEILALLDSLFGSEDPNTRQTAVNAAGEIGIIDFAAAENLVERGMTDRHHQVKNAVIGSLKKIGEKNPKPVLKLAERFLDHHDAEIRREVCHGIELRGRTHPEDVLPLLEKLQYDKSPRVKNMLVHVLGQIAYKKGCLQIVTTHLKHWSNREIVNKALLEIIDVHERYKNFAELTKEEAEMYIKSKFKQL